MTIKGLFDKNKIAAVSSYNSESINIESPEFLDTKIEDNATFVPLLDFSDPNNFIKFGSAELYYSSSINRIYQEYPYDGSGKEKLSFQLSSSYLDRWLFEKKYPMSTGYITFNASGYGTSVLTEGWGRPSSTSDYEYISAFGGLHTASAGMATGQLYKNFDKSVIYNASTDQTQNFLINPMSGTTIEWWLNKDQFIVGSTEKETIVDIWNNELSSSADYGRLTIYLTGSGPADGGTNPIRLNFMSGTTGFVNQSLASSSFTTSSLADGNWHHYALSILSQSAGVRLYFYVDGVLNNEQRVGPYGVSAFTGRTNAYVGALQSSPSGTTGDQNDLKYAGKLIADMDEFRFWKSRRTSREINLHWYRPVDGGANTELNNTALGCYYKFNEGITTTASIDSKVLDYSGRLTNGAWTGYTAAGRNTGSCFTSASVSVERGDPIIYRTNPLVSSLYSEMQTSGSKYDLRNTTYLYKRVPSFLRSNDEMTNKDIKFLYQIISSYFDTLYAQIKILPQLTQKNYLSSSLKPLPFANRLLESRGFITNELFVDSDVIEYYDNNDLNNIKFEDNVDNIKNLIYHNIYNNLDGIYKSKGTEQSLRNLLRCFGIDDELVKLSVYTDGGTHYFNDNFKDSSITKTYINNNAINYFSGSSFQSSSVIARSFITGSGAPKLERFNALTLEIDTVIPYKVRSIDQGYFGTPFVSASIGGFHQANDNDYDWAENEVANLQMYLIRDEINSNRAKFLLTNQDGTINLSSSYYDDIYDNNRWVLAARVKPVNYGVAGSALTSSNPTYELSFYGVNNAFGSVRHSFNATASLNYASGSSFLSNAKRIYVGAHRQNFSGSVLAATDLKFGACKYWFDYISDADVKAHAQDVTNFGVDNPTRNATLWTLNLTGTAIPRSDLLALNWDFDQVTGSNASTRFEVADLSSGSTNTIYGWIDGIIRRNHEGTGISYGATQTSFVKQELVYTSKKELPEFSFTSDNIFIQDEKQVYFITDDDVSDNFYSLEKSMYQIVSEEMLDLFSSAVEFNTLIGQSVERYRGRYRHLEKMRETFFRTVQSDLDFDRFTNYYKWIDDAITDMVTQLFPASVRHSERIANTIESHILERNKYQNKFPLTTRLSSTEGNALGIGELQYNWKFGHAPIPATSSANCLWQDQRKERSNAEDRQSILDIATNYNNAKGPILYSMSGAARSYSGSAYAINTLAKPYKLNLGLDAPVHGGINYNESKDREFVYNATYIHGPVSLEYPKGIPQNVMVVGVGDGQGVEPFINCSDELAPNQKRKWNFDAVMGRFATGFKPEARAGLDYEYKVKGSIYWPTNVMSGNVKSGYQKKVVETFKSGTIITNIHADTFSPTNEIGLQSPFTNAWVGGHQSRHVDLNKYSSLNTTPNNLDAWDTRPEAWRLLFRECGNASVASGSLSGSADGAMGFVGPDYGGPYPDYNRKYAVRYREERVKRPVNLKNIQTTTASVVQGNFTNNYEVISTFGTYGNSPILKEATGSLLPHPIAENLPATTNYQTLMAQTTGAYGNVFGNFASPFGTGSAENNRQYVKKRTSGVAGQYASGTVFSVAPYDVVTVDDQLKLKTASGGTYNIYISGGVETGPVLVRTGSSNEGFWDDIVSAVDSGDYTNTTYVSGGGVISDALLIKAGFGAALRNDLEVDNPLNLFSPSNTDGYAWSGWILRPSNQAAQQRTIFAIENIADGRSKMTSYINSGGDFLAVQVGTENGAGSYLGSSIWTYWGPNKEGFENVHDDQWTHVGIVLNSSSVPTDTSLTMYINGVSASIATPSFTGVARFYSGSSMTMYAGQNGFAGGSPPQRQQWTGSFSEWSFMTGGAPNSATMKSLYNFGYQWESGMSAQSVPGLGAHWMMGGTGSVGTDATISTRTTIYDQTGNGFNITGGVDPGNTPLTFVTQRTTALSGTVENLRTPTTASFTLTASSKTSLINGALLTVGTTMILNGTSSDSGWYDLGSLTNGVSPIAEIKAQSNIIEIQRDDLTGSDSIIRTRFSAPGGPEINTRGYLDIGSQEFSAYNAMPYRNLTVLSSGSGEHGTIRVDSQLGKRDGLQTMLRRHMGKFGIDSQFAASYNTSAPSASYTKIPRNTMVVVRTGSLIIKANYDNEYVTRAIPAQDYGYAWVTSSLGQELSPRIAGEQLVFGYWPVDGTLSASANVPWRSNGFDTALNYPTSSAITGIKL